MKVPLDEIKYIVFLGVLQWVSAMKWGRTRITVSWGRECFPPSWNGNSGPTPHFIALNLCRMQKKLKLHNCSRFLPEFQLSFALEGTVNLWIDGWINFGFFEILGLDLAWPISSVNLSSKTISVRHWLCLGQP